MAGFCYDCLPAIFPGVNLANNDMPTAKPANSSGVSTKPAAKAGSMQWATKSKKRKPSATTRKLAYSVSGRSYDQRRICDDEQHSPPHSKELLQRQIDATDRQIDRLVYQLYSLIDEEIRIVEGRA